MSPIYINVQDHCDCSKCDSIVMLYSALPSKVSRLALTRVGVAEGVFCRNASRRRMAYVCRVISQSPFHSIASSVADKHEVESILKDI